MQSVKVEFKFTHTQNSDISSTKNFKTSGAWHEVVRQAHEELLSFDGTYDCVIVTFFIETELISKSVKIIVGE